MLPQRLEPCLDDSEVQSPGVGDLQQRLEKEDDGRGQENTARGSGMMYACA